MVGRFRGTLATDNDVGFSTCLPSFSLTFTSVLIPAVPSFASPASSFSGVTCRHCQTQAASGPDDDVNSQRTHLPITRAGRRLPGCRKYPCKPRLRDASDADDASAGLFGRAFSEIRNLARPKNLEKSGRRLFQRRARAQDRQGSTNAGGAPVTASERGGGLLASGQKDATCANVDEVGVGRV
jgi:hypothetical protein